MSTSSFTGSRLADKRFGGYRAPRSSPKTGGQARAGTVQGDRVFRSTRNTAATTNRRDGSSRNVNGSALSLAIHPDPAPADLGRPAVGHRLAQADRRRLGLCRELGNLGLSRCGQRRRERPARRFDDPRADHNGMARGCSGQLWAAAISFRCWSSTSTRIKTSRSRFIPMTQGPAAGRRQRQDRDLGHPGSRARKCDLRRTEARRRPRANSPKRSVRDAWSPCSIESSRNRAIAS